MKRIAMLPTLIALLLFTSEWYGQPPGVKSKPETKEEKLKEAQIVTGDLINLFEEADVGPGEVDKRRDEFLKKHFSSAGGGFFEVGKNKYLVTTGEVEFPFEAKPLWTTQRILALNRAELEARAKMVEAIESKLESGQLFESFQADYGASVKKDIAFIEEAQKKGAISGKRYKEANRSFAAGQVVGAVTIKTIEGINAGQYKVVRIMLWSPKLQALALNTIQDVDYLLPLEKVTENDLDQIPTKEADLVRELGCKCYFNKKGQRYYVSYGQAEPKARNKDEISQAMEVARDRAELAAKGALARTLAAEVCSAKLADMTSDELVLKEGKAAEMVENFYKKMESVSNGLKVKGMTVHKTWTYKHPEWKSVVVGCVVVWTPDTRSFIKEVGLDKRFDVNSAEALASFLAKTYVRGETVRPIGKTKIGDNDSQDPKKLP